VSILRAQILFLLLTCLLQFSSLAQLVVGPLPATPSRSNANARIQSDTPIDLPFWDDFSSVNTHLSHVPDTSFWVDSQSVFVGSGDGFNLPSINAGVLNGLDSLGSPYNPNEPTTNGFNDKLLSRKIRMTAVPVASRNTVYLSFFFQWKGNGEAPDDNDFLRVEFKDQTGAWVEMLTIYGDDEAYDDSTFYIQFIPVNETRFYHDDFQFRLRNYGRASGPFDTWIVDYFYLRSGRNGVNTYFPDRAAASQITPLIGPFTSVPYNHFLLSMQLDSIYFDVYNLRTPSPIPAATTYEVTGNFRNYFNGSPTDHQVILVPDTIGINGPGLMQPGERVRVQVANLPDVDDPLQFNPASDSVDVSLLAKVIGDASDTIPVAFLPAYFTRNDTVSAHYYFRSYYAYDDGIAEYTAGLTQPGNRLAYRFDMLSDTATLYGVYVYFPYTGGSNTQTLDFFLYADDGGKPASIPLASFLSRTISKNGENRFFFIRFIEPIFLENPTFYFGWKEPTSARVKVGLDKNNDTNENIYVYLNGEWTNDTDVHGSLMIRPFFGKGTGVITGIETGNDARLYPNPNRGVFYLSANSTVVQVAYLDGRSASFVQQPETERVRVEVGNSTAGLYIVRWRMGRQMFTTKIAVIP
jgi:hypothetical protein